MANSESWQTRRFLKKAVIKGQKLIKKYTTDPVGTEHLDEYESGNSEWQSLPAVAVDAMGGDFAPVEIVKGAVRAARELNIRIQLVGPRDIIRRELRKYETKGLPIEIIHCEDYIRMDEKNPASAVKKQKNASIVVCMRQVLEGKAVAAVGAGSTGAAAASALLVLKRISGVERPAIAVVLPVAEGEIVLLDAGANVDSTPFQIAQHALMGSVFAGEILNKPNPRIGLLSIGEEAGKGNKIVKDTYEILSHIESLNFIGNVEGRTLNEHECDVVVCDGFVGNVFLKTAEGTAKMVFHVMAQELTANLSIKMGALMCKEAFRNIKNTRLNPAKYGGAALLGVKGNVIIAHGNSNDFAVMNAIRIAMETANSGIVEQITSSIEHDKTLETFKEKIVKTPEHEVV